MLTFFGDGTTPGDTRKRHVLTIRTHLRPVDVYSYLKARFGEPNGIRTFLRRDDSDNLVHWDFLLCPEDEIVYLSGASRETLIMVTEELSDEQWKVLINAIKADFARVATSEERKAHFAGFVIGMNACESAIEEARYLQAHALLRQEMEILAQLKAVREGRRKPNGSPKCDGAGEIPAPTLWRSQRCSTHVEARRR